MEDRYEDAIRELEELENTLKQNTNYHLLISG